MRTWAQAGGLLEKVCFLCVCVDPNALATAQEFARLYFKAAPESLVNGFIDSQSDFPKFQAQLGCQGFIVFNSAHQLVHGKTVPWMQYRDGAFRDVEDKLCKLLQPAALENPLDAPLGWYVKVTNLTSASGQELNGQLGVVAGSSENGRFAVKLQSATKSFRAENLMDAHGAPVGKTVKVFGLTSEKGSKLNGQVGEVRGSLENGRYIIRLPSGDNSLRPENVIVLEGDNAADYLADLESVGHEEMDKQHDSCMTLLRTMAKERSTHSLRLVRDEIAEHFAEEEAEMKRSDFGGACCQDGSKFSAFSSHCSDHRRIIEQIDAVLESLANACQDSEGSMTEENVKDICRSFHDHARLYDNLYVGKLGKVDDKEAMDDVD
eukprot:TRINITY_DN44452_c0_g1_i1.p1 TRINITY_DN44452_c0_g1~~TRINITY_DN44452_c0_g1_i1.p1  ORF type:complete len:378 (+),score=80.08 TRINITY_DN44452_c0_g1_i1:222-1355(+)